MAMALEQVLGDALEGGIVIVTDGHKAPCNHIRILEAAHPVPDRRSVKATQGILSLVQSLTPHDLLIVLLSGGASSLLCAPAAGLTLADKQRTTRLLLRSGAAIHDMNVVRKHMSAIKGGQLAQATPATILTFIISDVLGDDLATIGSGPTVPGSSTFQDAIDILKQYKIWSKVPMAVQRHLKKRLASTVPDILKPPRQRTSRNRHIVLANNSHAIKGLAKAARQLKLKPFIMPFPFQGEAKEVGNILGSLGRDLVEFDNPARPPACLIAGGEPTVTIKGNGKGGRVQECMVAAAQELAGLHNIFVAGFGTDGTDGPTDAAGAIVDGTTAERASKKGLDISRVLNNHDSYNFFKHVGGHIITGPTGTNVNDIYFIFAL
jgi:hydroxypyruvate reductase